MCFLRIRPEHAPMNPPGAAPTLTNIYNEDKYFAPPSSPGPKNTPSNPNAVPPKSTQPTRGPSNPPSTAPHPQQQPRHNYPRYHHHEDRRGAAGDQPTTTALPIPKTKRKNRDNPEPATRNNGGGDDAPTQPDPAAISDPTPIIHGAPNHSTIAPDHNAPEQRTRTKFDESLDVGGAQLPTGLGPEYDGLAQAPSLRGLGMSEGIEREQRVEGMRKEVEGLEREVRGIGRAL